jgi:hypothetical protein
MISSNHKYVTLVLEFILVGVSFGHGVYPFKEDVKLVLHSLESPIIM